MKIRFMDIKEGEATFTGVTRNGNNLHVEISFPEGCKGFGHLLAGELCDALIQSAADYALANHNGLLQGEETIEVDIQGEDNLDKEIVFLVLNPIVSSFPEGAKF